MDKGGGVGLVYICICLILLVKVGALLLVVVVWGHNRLRTLIFFVRHILLIARLAVSLSSI